MKRIRYLILFLFVVIGVSGAIIGEEITFEGTDIDNVMTIEDITPTYVLENDVVRQQTEVTIKTNWKGLYINIPDDMTDVTKDDVISALETQISPTLLEDVIVNVNDEEGVTTGDYGVVDENLFGNSTLKEASFESITQTEIGVGYRGLGGIGTNYAYYDIVFVMGITDQTVTGNGVETLKTEITDWADNFSEELKNGEFRMNIIEVGGRKGFEKAFYLDYPTVDYPLLDYPAYADPYLDSPLDVTIKGKTYEGEFLVGYNKWLNESSTDAFGNPVYGEDGYDQFMEAVNLVGSINTGGYGTLDGENTAWGIYKAIEFLKANDDRDAQKVIVLMSNQPIALYENGVSFLDDAISPSAISYSNIPAINNPVFSAVGTSYEQKIDEAKIFEAERDTEDTIYRKAENAMIDYFSDEINSNEIDFVLSSALSDYNGQALLYVRTNENFKEVGELDSLGHERTDLYNFDGSHHVYTYPLQLKSVLTGISKLTLDDGTIYTDPADIEKYLTTHTQSEVLKTVTDVVFTYKDKVSEDLFYEYESSEVKDGNVNNIFLHNYTREILEDYFLKKSIYQKWKLTYISPYYKTYDEYKKVSFSIDDFSVTSDGGIDIVTNTELKNDDYNYLVTTYGVTLPAKFTDEEDYVDRYYSATPVDFDFEYLNPAEADPRLLTEYDPVAGTNTTTIHSQLTINDNKAHDITVLESEELYYQVSVGGSVVATYPLTDYIIDESNDTVNFNYTLTDAERTLLGNYNEATIKLYSSISYIAPNLKKRDVTRYIVIRESIKALIDLTPPELVLTATNSTAKSVFESMNTNVLGIGNLDSGNINTGMTPIFTDEYITELTQVTAGTSDSQATEFYVKDDDSVALEFELTDDNMAVGNIIFNGDDTLTEYPVEYLVNVQNSQDTSKTYTISNIIDDFGNGTPDVVLTMSVLVSLPSSLEIDETVTNETGTDEDGTEYFNRDYTIGAGNAGADKRIVAIVLPVIHSNSTVDLPEQGDTVLIGEKYIGKATTLGADVSVEMTLPVSTAGSLRYDGEYDVNYLILVNQAGGVSQVGGNDVDFGLLPSTYINSYHYIVDTVPPRLDYLIKSDVIFRDADGNTYTGFSKDLFLDDAADTDGDGVKPGKSGDTYTISVIDVNIADNLFTEVIPGTVSDGETYSFTKPVDYAGNEMTDDASVTIDTTPPVGITLNGIQFENLVINKSTSETFPFTKENTNLYVVGTAYANAGEDKAVILSGSFNPNHDLSYLSTDGLKEMEFYSFSRAAMVTPADVDFVYDTAINYYTSKLIGTFIAERGDTNFSVTIPLRMITEYAGLETVTLNTYDSAIGNVNLTSDLTGVVATKFLSYTPDGVDFTLTFDLLISKETATIEIGVTDQLDNYDTYDITFTINDYLRLKGKKESESKVLESQIHIINSEDFNVDSTKETVE